VPVRATSSQQRAGSLEEGRETAEGGLGIDDRVGRSAAPAASWVERIDAEELVDEAAGDAHHGRAAVLALNVELVALDLWVVIAHPAGGANVAALSLLGLSDDGERLRSEAGLARASDGHDLQPAKLGQGLKRGEQARRHVGELKLSGAGEVAREADARLNVDDVEEAKHGGAAVLDLHDLIPAHVLGLDEAERVVDAERREDTNVTLLEHGGADGAGGGLHGRRLEGVNRLKERKSNGGRLHG